MRNNAAVLFVSMKSFEERKDASQLSFAVLPRLNRQFAAIKDGFVFATNPPAIPGLGSTGGFEFYVQNRGSGDPRATSEAVRALIAKARHDLVGVGTHGRTGLSHVLLGSVAERVVRRSHCPVLTFRPSAGKPETD